MTTSHVRRKALSGPDARLSRAQALERRSPDPGPLERLYFEHEGRPSDKWVHYLPFYDRVFASRRMSAVRLLELGVMQGGSLEIWRRFFGPDAIIFGIDIDPECRARVDAPNQVRIGSQADPAFLARVAAEMGGLDIVIDDGSHVASHQRASFAALWPRLAPGGLYIIEDLHTSYMAPCEGGYRRPGTGVEMVKQLLDDMHGYYHEEPERAAPRDEIAWVCMADSIVAIEKARGALTPGHHLFGRA